MLSYYTDSTFCILLQLHVYDKITDRGTNYLAPLSMILLLTLFCFLLPLLRLMRRQSSFRFLPFQLRELGFHIDDQHFELLLALLTGMGVDISGVLFSVDPHGRVTSLPQVRAFGRDATGTRPAAVG